MYKFIYLHTAICWLRRRRSGWNSGTHGERGRWVGAEWGGYWV